MNPNPSEEARTGASPNGADNPVGSAPGCAKTRATAPVTVPSEDLLRGHRTVDIEHNGTVYRLQSTRAGKLILTK